MRWYTNAMKTAVVAALLMAVAGYSGTAWARMVNCMVEVDRDVLLADRPQRAIVKVTLNAPTVEIRTERPPVNLAIVLDRSGSMSGQKLEKAKEAAIEALRRLGPQDMFSLVIYDHEVNTLVPAQSAVNVERIEPRIRSITARGNTALFGGVSQGASEVRKHLDPRFVHRIILLSDGLANVGPSSPEDLARLGAALIKENISVTTVGVGTDYNEDLMTRLSQASDGNTYFVESSRDLPHIFAAELGDVLNVVAKKVVVIIECPEGVRPLGFIGRDGRIKGRRAEIYLNQLYGGQQKYALMEVEVAPTRASTSREIAVARLSYMDPFTQTRQSVAGRASVRFSTEIREVEESANMDVQKDYSVNLNAIAQDRAISLADEGKTKEAARELRSAGEQLRNLGTQLNDKELLNKAEEMDDHAAQIESEGMTKTRRKLLRTDSYQERNQQMRKW